MSDEALTLPRCTNVQLLPTLWNILQSYGVLWSIVHRHHRDSQPSALSIPYTANHSAKGTAGPQPKPSAVGTESPDSNLGPAVN